jgi:glycosyltransferase XagB
MRGHMGVEYVRDVLRSGDHSSVQNSNARDWPHLAGAPAEFRHGIGEEIELERKFFHFIGWPPDIVSELERQARAAGVGLVQTAIASGRLKASDFYESLSRWLAFADGHAPYRVHLPGSPSQAWLLIERPVPIPAEDIQVVAVNGQSFSISRLMALSEQLGDKRQHLKLITRQELIDSVTQSYGPALVGRAVEGLMKEHPGWSAKTGLAAWQVHWSAIAGGLITGAFLVAPAMAAEISAFLLSMFFLLAILLRLAAVLNLAFPEAEKQRPRLLSDAELPRYTVFVPLFKEVEILPHLARALANLDYPGIMAQTPEAISLICPYFSRHGRDTHSYDLKVEAG